jgi:hypothetical protein
VDILYDGCWNWGKWGKQSHQLQGKHIWNKFVVAILGPWTNTGTVRLYGMVGLLVLVHTEEALFCSG